MKLTSKVNLLLGSLAVAFGLVATPDLDGGRAAPGSAIAAENEQAEVSELPDGVAGFSGQVGGIVVARQEGGRVLFKVVKVQRVWPQSNKASNPEALEGKTVLLRASAGEDSLQASFVRKMKVGEDYRLELKHHEASIFVIIELTAEQREIAGARSDSPRENLPSESENVDLTKAPETLYGFSGRVVGRLVSKDTEEGELTLQIKRVDRVWRGNKAKNPQSAVGRTLKIENVFGRFLDTLLTLREGDGVQIEVKHISGDNLVFLGEGLEKVSLDEEPREEKPREERKEEGNEQKSSSAASSESPAGLAGFRGILVGEVVSKDVEQGVLMFKMDSVKRVWQQNKAPKPELSAGKNLTVEGIAGKFLDVLLVLEPGDNVEVEAFHVRGPHLTFPGEWLKKIE